MNIYNKVIHGYEGTCWHFLKFLNFIGRDAIISINETRSASGDYVCYSVYYYADRDMYELFKEQKEANE